MAGMQEMLKWSVDSWDILAVSVLIFIFVEEDFSMYFSESLLAECTYSYSYEGTGLIVLEYMQCMGSESTLVNCSYDPDTSNEVHYKDVAVHCGKHFSTP